jgi:hypothetical protein
MLLLGAAEGGGRMRRVYSRRRKEDARRTSTSASPFNDAVECHGVARDDIPVDRGALSQSVMVLRVTTFQ